MSKILISCLMLISLLPINLCADDHGESTKSKRPEAQGKVIHIPIEVKTLEQFRDFIKKNTPKGSEPLLLLSGESWCANCVKLAPRLKGKIPASKVIFEIDTTQDKPKEGDLVHEKNILVNAIAKSKKFMKEEPNNELKQTRPLYPSLWRFDGDLMDLSKPLVEEGVGPDKISAWLDNPPVRINNGDWL